MIHFENFRRTHSTKCIHDEIVESNVENISTMLMMKIYRFCVIHAIALDLHNRLEVDSTIVIIKFAT